jgi:hypothetical protein
LFDSGSRSALTDHFYGEINMIEDQDITPEWKEEIDKAQSETHLLVRGESHLRIRYGDDHPNGRPRCRDCAAQRGQFHVFPCSVEVCPRCRSQAMGCTCEALH